MPSVTSCVSRFQQIQVTLLFLPLLLLTSHPEPHSRHPHPHANLSEDGELEAWLPRDRQGRPDCLRSTPPPRGPPVANGTEANSTEATEPCTSGWIYDNSTFPSTIVTEKHKDLLRKLSCGASVTGEDEIIIQGDFTDDILDVIQEKWPEVDDDSIEDLGEVKK
uniref:SUI1 domain-containing protein n=1 Tax=Molossus molossus TaxID=27622 RepID=A0A7J8ERE0_MOLMO|nr:hypothetical protein HJG59_008764 [Molossus molossus]